MISCESSDERITVHLGEREGSFVPERGGVRLELRGVAAARSVLVDGEEPGSRTVEVIL